MSHFIQRLINDQTTIKTHREFEMLYFSAAISKILNLEKPPEHGFSCTVSNYKLSYWSRRFNCGWENVWEIEYTSKNTPWKENKGTTACNLPPKGVQRDFITKLLKTLDMPIILPDDEQLLDQFNVPPPPPSNPDPKYRHPHALLLGMIIALFTIAAISKYLGCGLPDY